MKRQYTLSPLAQRDVGEIWDYTAEQWGIEQARTYTQKIGQAVERLTAHPNLGVSEHHPLAGYRKFRAGSHQIYYRFDDQSLTVVRVLHVRMDALRAIEH